MKIGSQPDKKTIATKESLTNSDVEEVCSAVDLLNRAKRVQVPQESLVTRGKHLIARQLDQGSIITLEDEDDVESFIAYCADRESEEKAGSNICVELNLTQTELSPELELVLKQLGREGKHDIKLIFGDINETDELIVPEYCTQIKTGTIIGTLDLSQAVNCRVVELKDIFSNNITLGAGIERIRTGIIFATLDMSQAVNCKTIELWDIRSNNVTVGAWVERIKTCDIMGTLDLMQAVNCKVIEVDWIGSDANVTLGAGVERIKVGSIKGTLDLRPAVNLRSFSCGEVTGEVIGES